MAEPGEMVAVMTASAAAGWRPGGQAWLPATSRVAPLAAVNSSSGHIVLTTTGGQGCGSG